MKLEEMTIAELKVLGYEQFIRRELAQQEAADATRALNAINAAIESKTRFEMVPPPPEAQ